ncbi:MAG: hypothetical protein Q8S54_14255 [Bacteroidota bacterium]|nr:hypothetical protein [Odoribacter sp.]MDP3644337.1 hypothetical protein [Bacteroidota bacterium]
MKPIIQLFLFILFLFSCATTNRIIEIEDSFKEIKGIKLVQNLKAYSSEKTGSFGGIKYYNLNLSYLFEKQKNGQSILNAEFQMTTPVSPGELDSILFLNLDHEKIKLISTEYKYNGKLMKRKFVVPENLWISIANSQEIFYRVDVGNEGIDVRLTASETLKVKEFFNRAIQQREAGQPPVPDGQKKW